MVNWTAEQERAIYTEGHEVLVAAAAGSGKTAVLVERIVQKLIRTENPVDIDSLLVVTFTNAAAREMRDRVGQALEGALAQYPTSNHLKKQLSLLQRASISTLHSFCLDVVKQYAYMLDIDPSFRIANDMEIDLMKTDVLDDLLEGWYGQEGDDQANFFAVVDRFSSDRSDMDVETLILDIYTFAMQHPDPEAWLDNLASVYDIPDKWEETDLKWLDIIRREAHNEFAAVHEEITLALEMTQMSDGPYQYAPAIEADLVMLEEARQQSASWNDLQAYMSQSEFGRLSGKKVDCSEALKDRVKKLRNSYKERWNKMKDEWFRRNLTGHVADMQELAPVVRQLTELVKAFKTEFTHKKQESALVDFSDLEHFCLDVLIDHTKSAGNIQPSSVAQQLQGQFSEVLVDEYQDTNLVQETILQLVSDNTGPGNLFMVGDVKQSIYSFRHAEPALFLDKYKRFSQADNAGERIDLARNFRSRPQVLSGANFIFRQILDEKLGDIVYDQSAELIYGNRSFDDVPLGQPESELMIIDQEATNEDTHLPEGEEHYKDLQKAELEARAYAAKIKMWIGQHDDQPMQIIDKTNGKQRDLQFRDIVILQRSMTWASTIVDELKQQGIPVYAELSTGYFEAIEVKVMLNTLKIIDNPRQDIPLASVLRSPIVGLDEETLAQIRLADRHGSYSDALQAYVRTASPGDMVSKVERFLKQFDRFRLAAREGALSDLVWQIYRETGYYDFVGGMPGGRQRQANLRALYDRARTYETTAFRGLFRFLRFIERMEEREDDLGAARALSEQEDVVRIMTIHKSKGLEFPVVILGGMEKGFNMTDLRQRYLLHKDLGFATRYIDPVKRISYPTLYYHALKQEKKRALLAEEMRVLYVALTRAKEKLVMIGTVNSFAKKQAKWQQMIEYSQWVLPAYYRIRANSYLDWVGPALARHEQNEVLRSEDIADKVLEAIRVDPSEWEVTVVHGSHYTNQEEKASLDEGNLKTHIETWTPVPVENDAAGQADVNRHLDFVYPYKQATANRAKQTVTEIKRQRESLDEYSGNELVKSFQAPIVKRPNFMQKESTISGAEHGTIMHTVMQHIPFKESMIEEDISAFAQGLVHREILTEKEAETVDTGAIAAFFDTDIARLMLDAPQLYRELPFSLALPAKEVYVDWTGETDEKVLIQGVVDCAIPTEEGWILLDYKTDQVKADAGDAEISKLKTRYEVQVQLYQHAIEQIWREPVVATYLYFFNLEGPTRGVIKV